ncbi:hypothetical protein ACIBO9_18415 [Streptomyces prunicolor]|uniref:hypothetical protein n=1 Tax=Streptomyces prunicolor TaxID=67348 RepID=UPI0037D687B8
MSENSTEPVPVTLDDEQLAQLAAAVTSGLAEYLVTEPVTAAPAEVTVAATEPVAETPEEPQEPDDGTQETVPSVSLSTATDDSAAETGADGIDGIDGSGTETA